MVKNTQKKSMVPSDKTVEISSGDMLKAMASPIRMRILGFLRVNGVQTVGAISARLGEAPGAISYHLSQLAQAGLTQQVRPVDGDKRKSWWRACQPAVRVTVEGGGEAGSDAVQAADLFRRSAAMSYEQAYERYRDAVPNLPKAWVEAGYSGDQVLRLTPDELNQMVEELNELIRTWLVRAGEHAEDDADTQQVALFLQAFRWIP